MSSSKAKADAENPRKTARKSQRKKAKNQAKASPPADSADAQPAGPRRSVLYVCVAVAAAVAGVAGVLIFTGDFSPAPELTPARQALQAAVRTGDPQQRAALAQQAEASAVECIYRGVELHAAQLHRCAAQGLRSSTVDLPADFNAASVPDADLQTAGEALSQGGHWAIVNLVSGELLRRNARDKQALELSARAQFELRDFTRATSRCQQLTTLDPGNVLAWKLLAYMYEVAGRRLQLIEIYPRLIELAPGNADEYHVRLVHRLIEIGDVPRARTEFNALKLRSPAAAQRQPYLEARLLHVEGDVARALARVRAALATQPDDTAALKLQGQLLMAGSQPADAIRPLRKAVDLAPDDAESHFLLGRAYIAARKPAEGMKHLQKHQQLEAGK